MRAEEQLINADLYERESIWQCQTDLLLLELLYRYGDAYLDAEHVS